MNDEEEKETEMKDGGRTVRKEKRKRKYWKREKEEL